VIMAGPKPHVCFLLPTLEVGGLEWMVVHLARAVSATFRVSVVCFDDAGDLAAPLGAAEIPVHVLRRRPGVDLRYPFRLARLLRQIEADVLHAHNDTALFYGGLAAFLGRVTLVYTEHDREFPGRAAVRVLNFALAASAGRVVAVSEELRRRLATFEHIEGDGVSVIPNGVPFAPAAGARERVRRSWGVPEEAPVVGVVAGLKPVKNHALLLDAAADLAPRFADLVLVFAGDGPLRAELEGRARRLGLQERIRLLGFRSDLGEVYAGFDVVALPSRSEGMPLTVIEAMAAARPVVASAVGGVPEVVVDGETGIVFPAGDREALGRALAGLLADPARRHALGEAGRRRYEERFTLERMAEAYASVYRRVLEGAACAG